MDRRGFRPGFASREFAWQRILYLARLISTSQSCCPCKTIGHIAWEWLQRLDRRLVSAGIGTDVACCQ